MPEVCFKREFIYLRFEPSNRPIGEEANEDSISNNQSVSDVLLAELSVLQIYMVVC